VAVGGGGESDTAAVGAAQVGPAVRGVAVWGACQRPPDGRTTVRPCDSIPRSCAATRLARSNTTPTVPVARLSRRGTTHAVGARRGTTNSAGAAQRQRPRGVDASDTLHEWAHGKAEGEPTR